MNNENRSFIEMKNVSVLRGGRKILDDINLNINFGENVALIGPNGSGKSTFIKLITSAIYPSYTGDSTVCKLFGGSRWNISDLRSMLGIVTNELQYDFHNEITGFEAVVSGFFSSIGLFTNHKVNAQMKKKALAMIDFLEVSHLKDKKLETMSSGEARRFLIARALVNKPQVLILDEPSNSLDIASAAKFHKTLRKIVSQKTNIVLVTHIVSDIIPEIDRFILFKDGKIFSDGSRREIFTSERFSQLFDMKLELCQNNAIAYLKEV